MKTALVLISLSSLYLINAAPLKRTREPKSTTTDAGFAAKYFHVPEFLKFSQNGEPAEPKIDTVDLPQKSRLSKILDWINIFKKSKPFGEPYLRAYMQPDGSYKWYFVYPGQMLYPAPDEFSFDTINQALQQTTPTTTTTTTTTTEPPTQDPDETPKPLYPLMGKIEYVKNETEPKENEWAITMSNSGPIFQPYGKILPPFDEPLLQQLNQGNEQNSQDQNQNDEEPQEEPAEESQPITHRKHKKHIKTSPPAEQEELPVTQPEELDEDEQPADERQEEAQEDNTAAYDNGEPDDNEPSADENNPDEEDTPQEEDEQTVEEGPPPADERTPEKKAKSPKPSAT